MKRAIFFLAFAIAIFTGDILFGATTTRIELKDGSVIVGELESYSGGVYSIRSGNFGVMRIEDSLVRRVTTGTPAESKPAATSGGALPSVTDQVQMLQQAIMGDEKMMQSIGALQNDPAFQDVLQDSELMKAVNAGDVGSLISNPKFMRLLDNSTVQEVGRRVGQ